MCQCGWCGRLRIAGKLLRGQSRERSQRFRGLTIKLPQKPLMASVYLKQCGAMAVRVACVLVFIFAASAKSSDNLEAAGMRVAMRVLDECINADSFSPCMKKKALTFVTRLGRMDKLPLAEGVIVVRAADSLPPMSLTEEQLENSLPRTSDARDAALDNMLMEKITTYVGSRTLQVTMPKFSDLIEEGRGKKMKGMMGGMMMGIAAKMMAMIPIAIAGLFLLAGKALITAKIALLLAGIIAIKKLVASKSGGGGGGHGGWQSGGGWNGGGGGGGWDRRSLDSQNLAYKAYTPTK